MIIHMYYYKINSTRSSRIHHQIIGNSMINECGFFLPDRTAHHVFNFKLITSLFHFSCVQPNVQFTARRDSDKSTTTLHHPAFHTAHRLYNYW